MQLMFDALAPSNVPWLNPGVIKEAMDTGGASLVHGMQNFIDDVQEQRRLSAPSRHARLRSRQEHRARRRAAS